MPSLHQLNVSLTPELDQFVRGRVASGQYVTSSEVVRDALRLLQLRESEAEAAIAAIKSKLNRASAQADRGESVDGEAFFDSLLQRLERGGSK